MNIDEKICLLGIQPIDDVTYCNRLKDMQLLGRDVSKFRYYKMYGKTPMFYTEEYLLNNEIDELKVKDKKSFKHFHPSLFEKIKFKFQVYLLKYF